jgi:hypothetical protein
VCSVYFSPPLHAIRSNQDLGRVSGLPTGRHPIRGPYSPALFFGPERTESILTETTNAERQNRHVWVVGTGIWLWVAVREIPVWCQTLDGASVPRLCSDPGRFRAKVAISAVTGKCHRAIFGQFPLFRLSDESGIEANRASQLFVRCSDAFPFFRYLSESIENGLSARLPSCMNSSLFVPCRSRRNRHAEYLSFLSGQFLNRCPFTVLKDGRAYSVCSLQCPRVRDRPWAASDIKHYAVGATARI